MPAFEVVLAALLLVAGCLLVVAGAALWRAYTPDDPGYTPRHLASPVTDELRRALSDSRRSLRRSPAPWATQGVTKRDVNP